jgi:hypothetical protein
MPVRFGGRASVLSVGILIKQAGLFWLGKRFDSGAGPDFVTPPAFPFSQKKSSPLSFREFSGCRD